MKIIKQGKTEEELKVILNKTKRFKCKTCGCIFEADKGEYEYSSSCLNEGGYYYCICPNCKKNAHEVKRRETDKKDEDKPKFCYDSGCIYHIGINGCMLTFPTGTSFEKMSICPYRMPMPLRDINFEEMFR